MDVSAPGTRWDWAAVKPCGTLAAYRRHLRRGEPPCESCRQANSRANDDRDSDAYNRLRRERYARARAAGKSSRYATAHSGSPARWPL